MLESPHLDPNAPIPGCWVKDPDDPTHIGQIIEHLRDGQVVGLFGPDQTRKIVKVEDCINGIQPGFLVQDVPLSAARKTLGLGLVVSTRDLAGQQQCCVQFIENASTVWLPYQRLRRVMDPKLRFVRHNEERSDSAERTALHLMARALINWNDATGALGRLDIDPLPHQITLVHRILNSGSANWIIADDVGLGKTIEVGLLLGALERKHRIRRVLVIVPSGLTRQWKEEMRLKFDRRFRIYGRDFEIDDPDEWASYNQVVTSLDLVKPRSSEDRGEDLTTRFGKLLNSGQWDLVIFDEAHRLSRGDHSTTLRFRLAHALRERCDNFLMLTGTPHQGDISRFQNLLRLARPDLDQEIRNIDQYPEIVGDIIIRNRKSEAIDIDGNFLFKGLDVHRIEIPSTPETTELQKRLTSYLRNGYSAAERIGGSQGRAIGFVMTIYRKLAASSFYALNRALQKRREKLLDEKPYDTLSLADELSEESLENLPEDEERFAESAQAKEFFSDEIALLDAVIEGAEMCLNPDIKFLKLLALVGKQSLSDNLLIFTEYRATQDYLAQKLSDTKRAIITLNGSMSVDEKRDAVERFELPGSILISTEAGGEGLNMQRSCHVMVNYDLPWNPARLSQRIGRLYRYGQDRRVVVFNFHGDETIDSAILSSVLVRTEIIAKQMAVVSSEYNDRYFAEILGEMLDRLDISQILKAARLGDGDLHSQESIEAALKAAKEAQKLQDEILADIGGFDPDGWRKMEAYDTADLAEFIKRAAASIQIEIQETKDPERFQLRLPETLRGKIPSLGKRMVLECTTRRSSKEGGFTSLEKLDFASPIVDFLLRETTSGDFGGMYGNAAGGVPGDLLACLLHLQNDQGHTQGADLLVATYQDGKAVVGKDAIRPLFGNRCQPGAEPSDSVDDRNTVFEALLDAIELEARSRCNQFNHPAMIAPLAVLRTSG